MYAVYAQCASVRPIQPFYLTKREAPYKEDTSSCQIYSILLLLRTVDPREIGEYTDDYATDNSPS
jgi:hypothetical protein